jgi:biopolymer transport protein ExbD
VIIVSLIDVLLVVLIFLMVTTAFKDTPAFKITLPETSKTASQGATENPPIIVTITTNMPVFYLGRVPVTLDRLKQEFVTRAKENPKVVIAIRADDQAAYGNVVKVTEAAQSAQVMEIRTFLKPGIKPE